MGNVAKTVNAVITPRRRIDKRGSIEAPGLWGVHIGAYMRTPSSRYTKKLDYRSQSYENGHLVAFTATFVDCATIRIVRAEHNREEPPREFRFAEPPCMSRRHSRQRLAYAAERALRTRVELLDDLRETLSFSSELRKCSRQHRARAQVMRVRDAGDGQPLAHGATRRAESVEHRRRR